MIEASIRLGDGWLTRRLFGPIRLKRNGQPISQACFADLTAGKMVQILVGVNSWQDAWPAKEPVQIRFVYPDRALRRRGTARAARGLTEVLYWLGNWRSDNDAITIDIGAAGGVGCDIAVQALAATHARCRYAFFHDAMLRYSSARVQSLAQKHCVRCWSEQ